MGVGERVGRLAANVPTEPLFVYYFRDGQGFLPVSGLTCGDAVLVATRGNEDTYKRGGRDDVLKVPVFVQNTFGHRYEECV